MMICCPICFTSSAARMRVTTSGEPPTAEEMMSRMGRCGYSAAPAPAAPAGRRTATSAAVHAFRNAMEHSFVLTNVTLRTQAQTGKARGDDDKRCDRRHRPLGQELRRVDTGKKRAHPLR